MKGWYFFMKRIITIIIMSIITLSLVKNESLVVVPDESIRFRVIAASNTIEDINVKNKVASSIGSEIVEFSNKSTINDARSSLKENLDNINKKIDETFETLDYKNTYNVNYGINYFPEKVYKGVKYNEGYYESLVVTIGEGEGNNYWCVLYPPLCMIESKEESEKVEYKFLVKEIIDNFKSINK